MKYRLALCVFALNLSSRAEAQAVYGPPAPKPFVFPERMSIQPNETLEQAQAKVEKDRRCAKRWAIIGAVGGGALDIVTTQINQADGYRELNPIYGKRASIGEMIVFRGISGAYNVWHLTRSARKYPAKACQVAKFYAGFSLLPGVANVAVRLKF